MATSQIDDTERGQMTMPALSRACTHSMYAGANLGLDEMVVVAAAVGLLGLHHRYVFAITTLATTDTQLYAHSPAHALKSATSEKTAVRSSNAFSTAVALVAAEICARTFKSNARNFCGCKFGFQRCCMLDNYFMTIYQNRKIAPRLTPLC